MRKLKLQMQITIDGFVADPEGQLDWMTDMSRDEKFFALLDHRIDTSDTILMGRKMTEDFINQWEGVKSDSPLYEFAGKMVRTPKIVFSRTLKSVKGQNVRVENGPLVEMVTQLKNQPGKDILVYGGATFASSLIESGLIDEFNFFVNPVAIGQGMRIFTQLRALSLVDSVVCPSGVVLNTYT